MKDKVKIGLIGCGNIAQTIHLQGLKLSEKTELVGACDADIKLARLAAGTYGIDKYYSSLDEMLENTNMDALLIATRENSHCDLAMAAMKAGKHVLIEKPMAVSIEECEKMRNYSKENNIKLQVGLLKRFDPSIQFAHRFLNENIGEVLLVNGWYYDSVFHPQYVRNLGKFIVKSDAKVKAPPIEDKHLLWILCAGVHNIDLIHWFGKKVSSVYCTGSEKNKAIISASALEFENGARGTFQLISKIQMDWQEGITVHGTKGSIIIDIPFPYFNNASKVIAYDSEKKQYITPAIPAVDLAEKQLDAFADCILNNTDPAPGADDGLEAQKIISAMQKSYINGTKVTID